jgi:hypothetical protein
VSPRRIVEIETGTLRRFTSNSVVGWDSRLAALAPRTGRLAADGFEETMYPADHVVGP